MISQGRVYLRRILTQGRKAKARSPKKATDPDDGGTLMFSTLAPFFNQTLIYALDIVPNRTNHFFGF